MNNEFEKYTVFLLRCLKEKRQCAYDATLSCVPRRTHARGVDVCCKMCMDKEFNSDDT